MKIKIRYIGQNIIELNVLGWNSRITEDITNLNGKVDDEFIEDLEQIALELREHNNKLKQND